MSKNVARPELKMLRLGRSDASVLGIASAYLTPSELLAVRSDLRNLVLPLGSTAHDEGGADDDETECGSAAVADMTALVVAARGASVQLQCDPSSVSCHFVPKNNIID